MDYYKNPNKNQLFLYSFMEIIIRIQIKTSYSYIVLWRLLWRI